MPSLKKNTCVSSHKEGQFVCSKCPGPLPRQEKTVHYLLHYPRNLFCPKPSSSGNARSKKAPPRCFVWEDRIELLSAYQFSHRTAAGASSQNSYPICSNFDCESASRYFFGRRRGIAHGGVGADSPHKMYPVHQSYPRQVAERQTNIWNGFLSVSNHSVHSAVQGSSTPFQGE